MFPSAIGRFAFVQFNRSCFAARNPLVASRGRLSRLLRIALPLAFFHQASCAVQAQASQASEPLPLFAVATPLTSIPLGALSPAGALSHFDAISGIQTDVIFGKNTEGPYSLSWKRMLTNSETVECDGRLLQRDIDYSLDTAVGTIRFAFALPARSTVRLTYSTNTPDVIRSAPETHLLHLDLHNKGKNRLRIRTKLQEQNTDISAASATPTATSQFDINTLQWTGSTPLLRLPFLTSQLDSRMFVDLQGGNWMDRGGVTLAQQGKLGKADINLTYSRAGALFSQSEESGIAAGQEALGAKFGGVPFKGVTLSGGVQQTASVPPADTKTEPTKTVTASGEVALELAKLAKTKVTSRVEDRFDKDGEHLNTETNVQLPRLPFAQTQLSGGVQTVANPKQERMVCLLAAASRPSRYLEVNGDARFRSSQNADNSPDPNARNTYGLKFNFAPSKRLKLGGGTIFNPEANGGILNGRRDTVNMESDWGFLSLRGQLGVDQDFDKSRASGTSEVGFDLHFSRFDIFSTGFRGQGLFDTTVPGTGTYLLGFKHRLGSTFDLMLNGELTRPLLGGDASKMEIKTEAKLGLRF